ncbi:VLRF1 family aeRF1-type release factor [Planococcus lenghuensis]|uniref:Antiporter n=1 Tax=Planococcus lenghuensis TaxID=2213202 RepID=A0A1Q2L3F5_9BACL|nr:VLRF1 family aeRF1-type release factor [Planococcus lenghuensis]AQQ54412.1 antiporter [Planococcus lenghuensis]
MTLYDELQELKDFRCDDRCVLTVYLNTDPADRDHQNGAWRIELKSGMKRLDQYLTASKDEKELKKFKALKEQVVKAIEDNQGELHKGVILFASPHKDLWSVHYVQVPVETNFHWEDRPMTEQLEQLLKAYPSSAVVLPSYAEIRLLDTEMGSVKEELFYEFDPGIEVWHERSGNNATGAGNNRMPELDARMRENLNRFYKEIASKVEDMKKGRGWKEIHVIGETESANTFAESLRGKPDSTKYKNLNNAVAKKVLYEVFNN